MGDTRTPVDDLPEHLQPPFDNVVASHAGPDGVVWEVERERSVGPNETVYVRPGHLLAFARREGRPPNRTEWLGIVRKHGAETKQAARTPDPPTEDDDG